MFTVWWVVGSAVSPAGPSDIWPPKQLIGFLFIRGLNNQLNSIKPYISLLNLKPVYSESGPNEALFEANAQEAGLCHNRKVLPVTEMAGYPTPDIRPKLCQKPDIRLAEKPDIRLDSKYRRKFLTKNRNFLSLFHSNLNKLWGIWKSLLF